MPALLWFRRDLRLGDLPPLLRAAADSDEVLACFVLDPRLEASSGGRRMQFLCDSLRQLRDDLDGRLLVTRGRPEERIPALVKELDAQSVHVSEDFAPYGRQRDERVRSALGDVPLVATGSPYLVSPGRVIKDDGEPYKVFTPFFRSMARHRLADGCAIRSQVRALGRSHGAGHAGQTGRRYPTRASKLDLPAGEAAAQAAVEEIRRQRARGLWRRPKSTRPRRHQPDVGASEVRHHPPAHHGRRLGPAARRRASVLARVGFSRLLRRGAASLAATASGGTGTATSTPSRPIPAPTPSNASKRGRPARQDSRSSTPACVNFATPASCTTGCG